MNTDLLTEEELADLLKVTPRMAAAWRREYDWPCLRFKRRVRYTPEQVATILASHEHKPQGAGVIQISGQTRRSAGRSR